MAELVGLTASIVQIAGAGTKLSTSLYNFAGSVARADQEIADIAGDVELTTKALASVGTVFKNENTRSIVSELAIQDAGEIIKRCEATFREISEVADKRRKICKDGKRSLSTLGKFSWPLKVQKVELLRRRLDRDKNSLMLLLQVLQLANGQAKGQLGESALEKEHERIRQLHQRQQESLRNLQALESKLNGVNLDGDKTRRESSPPSQVPNNEPSTTSSSSALQSAMKRDGQLNAKYNEVFASTENLKAYDSDDATSDEEGEHLTVDELSQCTGLVQELLEKISMLQQTLKATQSTFRCPKSRVHKLYRRFCWKFESEMVSAGGTNPSSLLDIPIRNSVPLSHSSSQQRTAIHLTNIPSVRVTGSADSEGLAPPQSDFASPGVDHAPSEGPQAPPLKISTNHSNPWLSSHSMGNCLPPDASPIHAPLSIMHERTPSVNSNSNIPSPVSISGPRSPLLSPVGDRRPSIATALGNIRHQSEDASSQDGDDAMSPRRNNTYKRSEEPPRDWQGRMICKHTECASITFDRKCEWSKHMDKHERPYKCTIQGCEKLQGFTYSGGLLRHEREVHHMHGGKKKSLFCPFADCKRSSGSGFTRKENLAEHIRRVHRRTTQSSDLSNLVIPRPDIEEDIIPKVHALSESPNQRVGDVREEDGAGLRQKRKSTWDADDSDRRGQFKRSRGEYEGQDARLPSLGQHMANHDNSGSNTAMDSCESLSIPMDQSGNTPSGEVEGKATKGKDIVSVLLEKWTIPIS